MGKKLKCAATAGLSLAVVIPIGLVALGGASTAASGPVIYNCAVTTPFPLTTPTTMEYDTSLPAKLYVGDPAQKLDLTTRSVVTAATVNQAYGIGGRFIKGTSSWPFTFNGTTTTVNGESDVIPLVSGQEAVLGGTTAGALTVNTPSAPGKYDLTLAKSFTSANTILNASQGVLFSPAATCTKDTDTVVDTVEVFAKASATLTMPSTTLDANQASTVTATINTAGADGNVEFTIDGAKVTSPVSAGKATAAFPGKPAGSYTVSAVYKPTNAYIEPQPISPLTVTVRDTAPVAVDTTTAVTVDPATIDAGQTATAKVRVTATAGTPTGTVVVTANGKTFNGTLSAGAVDVPMAGLAVGTHPVQVAYTPANPAAFKASSASGSVTVRAVPAADTTTAVTVDPASIEEGQTATAKVKVTSAAGTPTGTVVVTAGGKTFNGTLSAGAVDVPMAGLAVGTHPVQVAYTPANPAAFKASSASGSVTVRAVPAADTTTAVTVDPASIEEGQTATAKVKVTSAAGTPTGTVVVTAGGKTFNGTLSAGAVDVPMAGLAVGTHPVQVAYTPANPAAFKASSASGSVTVRAVPAADTTTAVTVDPASIEEGQTATAKVKVTSAAGTPTGTVVVTAGGKTFNGTLSAGAVDVPMAGLAVGTHPVQVAFTPANPAVFKASSASGSVTVRAVPVAADTTTTVTLDPATIEVGKTSVAKVKVAAAAGTPAGTVVVTVDGKTFNGTLSAGAADVTVSGIGVGSYSVTAAFTPTNPAAFKASSGTGFLTVNAVQVPAADTLTTVVMDPAAIDEGKSSTARITVTAATGTPSGTVVVTAGGKTFNGTLTAGSVDVTVSGLAVGTHPVQVAFTPANPAAFKASTGTGSLTVNAVQVPAADTTTSVTVDPASIEVGQTATAKVKVTAAAGTPTGTVVVTANGKTFNGTLSAGAVDVPMTGLGVGTHAVQVAFTPANPAAFKASSASGSVTVRAVPAADTTTSVVMDPATIDEGKSSTAKVKVTAAAGTPAGTVVVTAGGKTFNGTLTAGAVDVTVSGLAVGTHPVQVAFTPANPAAFKASSGSGSLTVRAVEVPAADTTTSVVMDPATIDEGKSSTAKVKVTAAAGTPAGTVVVTAGGKTFNGTLTAGAVDVTVSGLAVGTHPVQVAFTPANPAAFKASSGSGSLTVRAVEVPAADTTTSVVMDPATIDEGQSSTAKVKVTAAAGTPGGTVTVTAGGKVFTGTLVAGAVDVTVSGLGAGTYDVTATFTPANPAAFKGSSATATLTVKAVDSGSATTTATSVLAPSKVAAGQPYLVLAKVTPGASGTVTFTAGGQTFTSRVVLGVALGVLKAPARTGNVTVTATFTPDNPKKFTSSTGSETVSVVKCSGWFCWLR